jgi:glutathione S-transferase
MICILSLYWYKLRLYTCWTDLIFNPDDKLFTGPNSNLLQGLRPDDKISLSMKSFMHCIRKVDTHLLSTSGPWFFEQYDYPTTIDFTFISQIERMIASCAFWKGFNLRDPKWKLNGLNRWLIAFERREAYHAFKGDYYTHIKDIPEQHKPGCIGGFEDDRIIFSRNILGKGKAWKLPLSHDELLQPLYLGLPLPRCALTAAGLTADDDGSYKSCDPVVMANTCRIMAAWKLSGKGPKKEKKMHELFQAILADPDLKPIKEKTNDEIYEEIMKRRDERDSGDKKKPLKRHEKKILDLDDQLDLTITPAFDATLRIICAALLDTSEPYPNNDYVSSLLKVVPSNEIEDVVILLRRFRKRIRVPRDLPLASARYLRAYIKWGMDVLLGKIT